MKQCAGKALANSVKPSCWAMTEQLAAAADAEWSDEAA